MDAERDGQGPQLMSFSRRRRALGDLAAFLSYSGRESGYSPPVS